MGQAVKPDERPLDHDGLRRFLLRPILLLFSFDPNQNTIQCISEWGMYCVQLFGKPHAEKYNVRLRKRSASLRGVIEMV